MQTPEPMPPQPPELEPLPPRAAPRALVPGVWGERLAWVAGLVLALSAFTGWYSGSQADGLTLSVLGWHTGALGKLVFFIGLAAPKVAVVLYLAVAVILVVPFRDVRRLLFKRS